MSRSLLIAASGLAAQQRKIDTLANNIANLNTTGFKRSRLDFADAVYTSLQNPALPADGQTGNLQFGHGVLAQATKINRSAGTLETTGRPLDLALVGEGYFTLETGGLPAYTRDGTFSQSIRDGRAWLVTPQGDPVLDRAGQRISSEQSLEQATIDSAGRLLVGGTVVAELGVVDFANPASLEAIGQNTFRATTVTGEPFAARAVVRQGCLEGSNVSLTDEMASLIESQRAYALMSRAISTADQMRATENEIRR
jgi:flagellar basal-body rod protein FlgG